MIDDIPDIRSRDVPLERVVGAVFASTLVPGFGNLDADALEHLGCLVLVDKHLTAAVMAPMTAWAKECPEFVFRLLQIHEHFLTIKGDAPKW